MIRKEDCERRAEELLIPICEANGFELVDVEYVKEGSDYYLRVYADKEGGIMIDDCVTISRALEAKLDAEDFIEEAYILEVSSPGLTRKLKKDKDYDRSIGKLVFVKLYKAEQGAKEFVGRLKEVDDKLLKLDIDGDEVVLDRNNISSARLEYED